MFLLLFLLVAALLGAENRPFDPEVLTDIQGTWGWVEGTHTCETNPHTIRLSKDGQRLTFTYPHPIVEATGRLVLQHRDPVLHRVAVAGSVVPDDGGPGDVLALPPLDDGRIVEPAVQRGEVVVGERAEGDVERHGRCRV
ncbi:MAG: hypothetical protein AAGI52_03900 [Bacteroidota bacterium]